MTTPKTKIAVLISGRGSNLKSLAAHAADPDFPAKIVLVASDNADAQGLHWAARKGYRTKVLDRGDQRGRGSFDDAVHAAAVEAGAEIICLAGFMRILGPSLIERWNGRILNIHPSLLPAFPGLDTHQRALDAGAKIHGCTVHLVTEGIDEGPILAQAAVPVRRDDTADTLAARVLQAEHALYAHALLHFLGFAHDTTDRAEPPLFSPPLQ